MKVLQFEVRGQYITRIDEEIPVAKCMNIFKAHFDFLTEEWEGSKTAIFVQGNYSKSQLLDEKNECIVPWEFFDTEEKTRGYVSVYCGNLMTANESKVMIAKTGYRESDTSVPPTPDVYQQILGEMDKKLDKSGYVPNKYLGTDSEGNVVEKEGSSGGGSGTTDYNDLDNKPQIAGVELEGNKTLEELGIQTKGEYALKKEIPTSLPASDVYDWAKQPKKPAYNADEVGALPKETEIPSRLSDMEADETHRTVTDEEKDFWNSKSDFSGKYMDLKEKPLTFSPSEHEHTKEEITDFKHRHSWDDIDDVPTIPQVPDKLPNPHKLIFEGVVTAEYDGSSEVIVKLPDPNEKLDKNQGVDNAGKALVIGEDGNVVPGEVQTSGGDGIAIVNTMSGESPLLIPDSAERLMKELKLFGKSEQKQDPPPSPDSQQEIKNTGKYNEKTGKYEIDVVVSGSNLLKENFSEFKTENNIAYIPLPEGHDNHNYTMLIQKKTDKIDNIGFTCGFYDKKEMSEAYKRPCLVNGRLVNPNGIVTDRKGTNHWVRFTPASEEFFDIYNVMYVEGIFNRLLYQPYIEPKTVTLTSDRPITKWDKLIEQDGQIGWLFQSAIDNDVRFSRKDMFPYSLILYKDHGNGVYTYAISNVKKEIGFQTSYCGQFTNKDGSYNISELWNYSDTQSLEKQYFNTSFQTIDEFMQWVEDNPLTMCYKTKRTEFVPLPKSEQDAIRALKTYYPTTVISVDGGELDADVEVTYTADTKNYIDNKFEQNRSVPAIIPEFS